MRGDTLSKTAKPAGWVENDESDAITEQLTLQQKKHTSHDVAVQLDHPCLSVSWGCFWLNVQQHVGDQFLFDSPCSCGAQGWKMWVVCCLFDHYLCVLLGKELLFEQTCTYICDGKNTGAHSHQPAGTTIATH